MQSWLLWLIIAAVLGTAELMTATLDLLLLAVAALAAAGIAGLGLGIGLQLLAFAVTAAAMITLVRPVARRHLMRHPQLRTGVAALIGREAVVLSPVGREPGRVRIGGEEWSARSYDPDLLIPAGTTGRRLRHRGGYRPRASSGGSMAELIVGLVVALLAVVLVLRTVRIVPQARASNVERLGRYLRTLEPGLNILIPFVDRPRQLIDLREQVISFEPRSVITEDNLVVDIDTVLYVQVTDPRAAAYEIANFEQAIEQLTVTTLRNVIGSLDLEKVLTSREHINSQLRGVLDEASGKWGIRVNRVELKAIDPPPSIKESMEKQMRADREKRAAILTAEGAAAVPDPDRRGRPAGGDPAGRGPGEGDRHRVRGDPPQRPGPETAGVPVPADAARAGQGPRQHVLGDPVRGHRGATERHQGVQRACAPRGPPTAKNPEIPPE